MTIHKAGGVVGFAFVVLGLLISSSTFMAAGFLLLLGTALALIFDRHGLADVELEQRFDPPRCAPGDEVTYTVEVTNPGRLPLPFLRFEVDWPEAVRSLRGNPFGKGKKGHLWLQIFMSLRGRERVRRSFVVTPDRRGHHQTMDATLSLSDPLGVAVTERAFGEAGRSPNLLVYPRLRPVKPPEKLFRLGEAQRARSLLDDPLLVRNLRDWRPGDPIRSVDWRATARTGDLIVRENEHAGRVEVSLFVNLDSTRNPWDGLSPDYHEAALELSGSLMREMLQKKVSVGLYANGIANGLGGERAIGVSLAPTSHPRQLIQGLTALAGLDAAGRFVDLARIMERQARSRPPGSTFLLVTPFLTEAIRRALELSRKMGIRPLVVQFWESEPGDGEAPPGVPVMSPDEVWA